MAKIMLNGIDYSGSSSSSDMSNSTIGFEEASVRENIASGEKSSTLFGKIKKWFTDLKAVAFSGSYNDLSDTPDSLPADGGNASTVNNHTVESNVPSGAKFTDTVYSLPSATSSVLGGVKTTDSSAVTDSTGLALAATEKNASINGTLANQIRKE